MSRVFDYLQKAGVFYLATAEADGQPRVRPFGAACEFEGKLYFITAKHKNVYKQLIANPKVEVCACDGPTWIRITGELKEDDRREARAAMLETNEGLRGMYNEDDGVMTVLYFENATATFSSFAGAPETVEL